MEHPVVLLIAPASFVAGNRLLRSLIRIALKAVGRVNKASCVIAALATVASARETSCIAMTFKSTLIGDTQIGLVASGPIESGDGSKLSALIAKLPRQMQIVGISLDSPGGLISEGIKLAQIIRLNQLSTYLDDQRHCFSACFLLFAAGKQKWASASAYVGVHSAALITGQETMITLGETGIVARILSELGVPDGIIGKMITTKPDRIASLKADDLTAMGVRPLVRSPFPLLDALIPVPDCIMLTNRSAAPLAIDLNTYPCRTHAFPGFNVALIARNITATMKADMAILDFQPVPPEKLLPADKLRSIRRRLTVARVYWIVPTKSDPQEELVRSIAVQFNDWMIPETLDKFTTSVLVSGPAVAKNPAKQPGAAQKVSPH